MPAVAVKAIAYTGVRYEYEHANAETRKESVLAQMGSGAENCLIPIRLYARDSEAVKDCRQ